MKEEKQALLLKRFAIAARAHHEALEELQQERANAQARMVTALYQSIVSEGEAGKGAFLTLVDSDDSVVAGMAAVFSLPFDPPRCVAVLKRLAAEPGLLGFRAAVALERWEAGEWEQQ